MKRVSASPPAISTPPPVWEYAISDADFNAILFDKKNETGLPQAWAVSRMVQHRSFYEVIASVSPKTLHSLWPQVKPTIKSQSVRSAYEYYLHKALPAAK